MKTSSAEQFNKLKISSAAGEENDLQVVIRAVYRQVLGNVSITETQRLTSAESRLRNGDFTIREFVRELALSDLYRSLFFEASSPYRFVELNFKHLLGRAPQDQAEIAEHVLRYNTQGYEAEVNSYIDSEEYTNSFGENEVPHIRGNQTQIGSTNVVFGRTSALNQGYASSDSSNQSTLISGIAMSESPKIQAPSRTSSAISNVNTSLPNSEGPKTLKDVHAAPYAEDIPSIIRSAYRQVLGNAHVMESERLASAESRVQNGEFTVREFIRAIALSDLYRSLFFETSSPYRFVELNFKHLLGRAPQDQAEIGEHVLRYTTQGYEAEINSYIDSEEYINSFGESEVPHIRGNQSEVGRKNIVFGRTSALNQGYATSDAGNQSQLISEIAMSLATKVESPSRSSSAISKVQTGLPSSDGPKTLKDVRSAPYTEDRSIIIRSAYRQVLGNAHVMESERLASAESRVQNGEFTVREFIRAIALSDLYRSLFFETSSPYRFVELNFKHLLGRAPQDQTEIAEHVIRYTTQGYEAEINSYIDSEEYTHSFGENEVPHLRGNQTQVGIKSVVYGRTFALQQGYAGSNKGKKTQLMGSITGNLPTKIKPFRSMGSAVSSTEKRYQIATTRNATTAFNQLRKETNTVSYSQLSRIIQRIHKSGAKILSITEIN